MVVMDAVSGQQPRSVLGGWLESARAQLDQVSDVLGREAPEPATVETAVGGVISVTTGLADLVATLLRQAPAGLAGQADARLVAELAADLQALHGCMVTGPLLLAPARDDLEALLGSAGQVSHSTDGTGSGLRGPRGPAGRA